MRWHLCFFWRESISSLTLSLSLCLMFKSTGIVSPPRHSASLPRPPSCSSKNGRCYSNNYRHRNRNNSSSRYRWAQQQQQQQPLLQLCTEGTQAVSSLSLSLSLSLSFPTEFFSPFCLLFPCTSPLLASLSCPFLPLRRLLCRRDSSPFAPPQLRRFGALFFCVLFCFSDFSTVPLLLLSFLSRSLSLSSDGFFFLSLFVCGRLFGLLPLPHYC